MRTHEEIKVLALSRPSIRSEYERLERNEMLLLDAILVIRKKVGLIQPQIKNLYQK